MLRRVALLAVLVAVAGLTTVAAAASAQAAVTSTTIDTPTNGTHYFVSDANPATNVTVSGTTDGGPGDFVDIRCYERPAYWENAAKNVPVQAGGTFSASMRTDADLGSCVLRAVPHGYPATGDVTAYAGPILTFEANKSARISTGPNAGKIYDYRITYQSGHAVDDYHSATWSGLSDTRLQYADGSSSAYLWWTNAALSVDLNGRSFLQVDGHDAYGPGSARQTLPDNPGFPQLTYSVVRDGVTGNATIHETDPLVLCPKNAVFPPTPASCPKFSTAGVRLERSIVMDDAGRQTHITDVWRSTDGKPHTVSAHYDQFVEAQDWSTGSMVAVPVGMRMPWLNANFLTFAGDAVYPGPASGPASVFVRDNNNAPDGSATFPQGAVSFDIAPQHIEWKQNDEFVLRNDGIAVPAGGKRITREAFAIGSTQTEVAAKAAANEKQIDPYRADGLVKKSADATYLGNNVYNTTGASQTTTVRRKRGTTAVFDVKVQNDGTAPDSFKLTGPAGSTAFAVHYFAGLTGSSDITTAVKNGSYRVRNLAPGATRIIRLVVAVRNAAQVGTLRTWRVVTASTHDSSRSDAVKAAVRVVTA
jgi:hypothetical protein